MIKKICILTNYNFYESKRHFTLALAAALNRRGIESKILDVRENALGAAEISSIVRFGPDVTCSFNSLLPLSKNQFLWDFLEIPHLSILVDPALYSINLINSPYSILSTVDRYDYNDIRSNGFNNVFFWPHAVEADIKYNEKDERPFDVVFLGSCYDYEMLQASWKEVLSEAHCRVLNDAIDIVLGEPYTSLAQALVKAWSSSNLPHDGVNFMQLFYYLDYYTRGKDRVDLINSIQDADIHIFGDLSQDIAGSILGWPQYLSSHPRVNIYPSVKFDEVFEILKKSKICLNSMPFFKNGSHERIFTSLICGAVPLTTDNLYMREMFIEKEDLFLYQSNHLEQVNPIIVDCLQHEEKRREIARNGCQKVKKFHTWDHRVDELLKELPKIQERIMMHSGSDK